MDLLVSMPQGLEPVKRAPDAGLRRKTTSSQVNIISTPPASADARCAASSAGMPCCAICRVRSSRSAFIATDRSDRASQTAISPLRSGLGCLSFSKESTQDQTKVSLPSIIRLKTSSTAWVSRRIRSWPWSSKGRLKQLRSIYSRTLITRGRHFPASSASHIDNSGSYSLTLLFAAEVRVVAELDRITKICGRRRVQAMIKAESRKRTKSRARV